jgi:outer membrane protein with glycine zipper
MCSLEFGKSLKALLALVITAGALTHVETASAQPYYYQPAPDYYHNDTASGTFMGGVMGAITGAVIGGKKHAGQDALIGAGVGAVTGNLIGRSKDRADEQRAAYGAAAVGQMNQQAMAVAVTDSDLIQMTRAGISDDVIVSTMRSRGTRIDLSPQSIISLRQQGVSDRVVVAAQQMGAGSGYVAGAPPYGPTIVREVPPPPAVIVEPAWRPYYHYHYCRPYYYRPYHSHTHVSIGF